MSGIPSFYLVLTHVEAVHLITELITIIIIIRGSYKLKTPVPTSQRKKLSVLKRPIRESLIGKYSLLI